MGTDIYGFIECRWDRWLDEDDRSWNKAADIADLYNGRSYAAFGSLFGVREPTTFPPLADCRGLPEDASQESRTAFEAWGRDSRGSSWITWAELAAVNWDELATEVDDCVHEYRRGADGTWELYGRNTGLTRFTELSGIAEAQVLRDAVRANPEGTEWPDGDRLFRVGPLRRRDTVPESDWGAVWAVMRTLAGLHGDEGVRLVVWFA
ncbi:hypothetical protein ACE1OC_21130 [Streptomyces sp. DSM 116496]|uniref:hypothetical protein n=1 Tax=Streptomyces stoeckheimensis TaxID=3344656 RepID=UPI0038B37067